MTRIPGSQGFDLAKGLLGAALDGIAIADCNGRIREFNPAAEGIFGCKRADMLGKRLEAIIPPAMRKAFRQDMAHPQCAGKGMFVGRRVKATGVRANGSEFGMELAITRVSLRGRSAFMAVLRDISEGKQVEAMCAAGSERLDAVMTEAGVASWDYDLLTGCPSGLEQSSPMVAKYTNGDASEWSLTNPKDRHEAVARFKSAVAAGGAGYYTEYRLLHKDGVTVRWLEVSTTILRDETGRSARAVGLLRDITERKDFEARTLFLAHRDELTGLPNRTLVAEHIGQAMAQADRSGDHVALLFVDLDRFKTVNDSLGHEVGDQLLRQVAARLDHRLRKSDFLARLGGDEFIMVLRGVKKPADAARVARKIVASLARPYPVGIHTLRISCSIGVSIYPDDGGDTQTLMSNADRAMYHVKDRGPGHYQLFSREMDTRVGRGR